MKRTSKIRDMIYIALFTAIIAVCAFITVPGVIPFTLQTFGVLTAVGALGGKRGTLTVLVYIALGALGVPVFSGFNGGIGVIAGPTGGFIIGFILSALVMRFITARFGKKLPVLIASMVLAVFVCYAVGTAWFVAVYSSQTGPVTIGAALSWCVIPFIIPDLVKIAVAAFVVNRLDKFGLIKE